MIAILLGALLLVLLARRAFDRPAVHRSRDRIVGHLLEIVVYRDLPREILACLGRLVRESARLGRDLLLPGLLLAVPLAVILLVLESTQSVRPFRPAEPILISTTVSPITVDFGGLVRDTDFLTFENKNFWRLHADAPGAYTVAINENTLPVYVEQEFPLLRSPWPQKIHVDYPPRVFWLGDHPVDWWVLFLLDLVLCSVGVEVSYFTVKRIGSLRPNSTPWAS